MYAACLAARRGKKTLVLARGLGGTHVGTGTIDVCKGEPAQLDGLLAQAEHPYNLIGRSALNHALTDFQALSEEGGYPMLGKLGRNISLPTAAGGTRQTTLVPETMLAGDLARPEPMALANLPGFRDFNASLAAHTLNASILNLPLPNIPTHRDAYATDMAMLFDLSGYRDSVVAAWKPLLTDAPKRLGLPAIMGLEKSLAAKDHLEKTLGLELFEIPILPPSVPGMRLFNILKDDFQNHGGRLIIGPSVHGQVSEGQAAVVADVNGREMEYKAETIFLATGGFLNGGLMADFSGHVLEPVFNLSVPATSTRASWTNERIFGPHPYAKFGLKVNKTLQPLNEQGKPVAANLRAIGSILAGADRLSEGSREGIELATAWRAVETVV